MPCRPLLRDVRHGRLPPCAGHDPGVRASLDHLIKADEAALLGRRAMSRSWPLHHLRCASHERFQFSQQNKKGWQQGKA
jgi:hypothetical protein